jgi:hypothetical protein
MTPRGADTDGAVDNSIEAREAAWAFQGGVFKALVPDNTKAIVDVASPTTRRIIEAFLAYAQACGFALSSLPWRGRRPPGHPVGAVSMVAPGDGDGSLVRLADTTLVRERTAGSIAFNALPRFAGADTASLLKVLAQRRLLRDAMRPARRLTPAVFGRGPSIILLRSGVMSVSVVGGDSRVERSGQRIPKDDETRPATTWAARSRASRSGARATPRNENGPNPRADSGR